LKRRLREAVQEGAWNRPAAVAWPRTFVDPRNRGECAVPLDPAVLKNWQEIQKKYQQPVNAIGVRIDPKDLATLKVWREAGLDRFLKK
jgi:hypothetical protein